MELVQLNTQFFFLNEPRKDLSHISNNNIQRTLYLKVKLKPVKLLEESTQVNLYDLVL